MNPTSETNKPFIQRNWTRRLTLLAFSLLTAIGMLAPQLKAGALYLDFATDGGVTTTPTPSAPWTAFYLTNAAGTSNVGGSGYSFSIPGVGAHQGGDTAQTLTRSGFYNTNYTTGRTFTLSGLNPNKPVKLYACAAWDAGRGAYIVYGDTGAGGVQAVTVGNPGTTGTLANMILIGTATANASGVVSGTMHGRNGVPGTLEGQLGGMVFLPTQIITATAGSNGAISDPGDSDVFAGDGKTYTFTADSGYHVANVVVNGVPQGPLASYTFTNVQANGTIHVTFAQDGGASYTVNASAGDNGSISPSGVTTYAGGLTPIYNFTPATGYRVAEVLLDGTPVDPVPTSSYTFSELAANHTLSVSFAIKTYDIVATAGANGSISPNGTTTLNYGTGQTYTITPASGYSVAELLVDGVLVTPANSYTFTNVTTAHTITVNFDNRTRLNLDFAEAAGVYTNTWNRVSQTGNMVSMSNIGGSPYGFTFSNVGTWSVNVATNSLTGSGFHNNISGGPLANPHAFSLTGLIPGQSVALYACASWGGNNQGAYVVYGDNAPTGVKAQTVGTPGNNPTLANLIYIGAASADATGKVTGNMYGSGGVTSGEEGQLGGFVFAMEAPPTWSITASVDPAGNHGTIDPVGVVSVASGANQSFTITPDSGYHTTSVLVDGSPVDVSGGVYTFNTVIANHTIVARFDPDSVNFTIDASADPNGSISPSGSVSVAQGTTRNFLIAPNAGYHIADVLVDGNSVGNVSSYQFTNVQANRAISAVFSINTFSLTASAGANGSISPVGTVTADYGSNHSFTITPDAGYDIDNVLVDGVSLGPVASYEFSNVTAPHSISATFDNRTKVKLDFTPNGGSFTSGWNPVYGNNLADTPVVSANSAPYSFSLNHVGAYAGGVYTQPLARTGFYTHGNNTNDHSFTLTGLNPGQTVTLYACAGWDGNDRGATVLFGDSGTSGILAQTNGDAVYPTTANMTLIGTTTADGTGTVTGSLHGHDGVDTDTEGQVGGFIFAISGGGAPLPDADNDGMLDSWEMTYFNSTDETAEGDFDNDGTDNLTEYRLELIPNSGSSMFQATTTTPGTLVWPSVDGVTFKIERSITLAVDSWEVLEAAYPGTAGSASYIDPAPPVGSAFYRVGLNP